MTCFKKISRNRQGKRQEKDHKNKQTNEPNTLLLAALHMPMIYRFNVVSWIPVGLYFSDRRIVQFFDQQS